MIDIFWISILIVGAMLIGVYIGRLSANDALEFVEYWRSYAKELFAQVRYYKANWEPKQKRDSRGRFIT